VGNADCKAVLLGTALASTLVLGSLLVAPTPAGAVACIQPPSPNPINTNTVGPDQPIICVNTEPRTNPAGNAINLTTNGSRSYIDLSNSGVLNATNNNNSFMSGVLALTRGDDSPIAVENTAAITATNTGTGNTIAIRTVTYGLGSTVDIVSSGKMRAYSPAAGAVGLYSVTQNGSVSIANSGDITVNGFAGEGIRGVGFGGDNIVHIVNTGDIDATGDQYAVGIRSEAGGGITIKNHGDILARATSSFFGRAYGINAYATGPISVDNTADVTAMGTGGGEVKAIQAYTRFGVSPVTVVNSGDLVGMGEDTVSGIYAETRDLSPISIVNSGDIAASSTLDFATGISAFSRSPVHIENTGDFTISSPNFAAAGIFISTGGNSPLAIINSGDLGGDTVTRAIVAFTNGTYSPISIANDGNLAVSAAGNASGIAAYTQAGPSPVAIENSGDIQAESSASLAFGIRAKA
jgi:hypothetical protein